MKGKKGMRWHIYSTKNLCTITSQSNVHSMTASEASWEVYTVIYYSTTVVYCTVLLVADKNSPIYSTVSSSQGRNIKSCRARNLVPYLILERKLFRLQLSIKYRPSESSRWPASNKRESHESWQETIRQRYPMHWTILRSHVEHDNELWYKWMAFTVQDRKFNKGILCIALNDNAKYINVN